MSNIYEVLIAGGGYAGQIAARDLARHGIPTLMVDRRSRPGWPPASTSGLARKWVDRWRLPVGGESCPITSFRLYGPSGESSVLGGGLLGEVGDVMVEPDVLARMEADSVSRGVEVLHNETVMRLSRDGFFWHAELLRSRRTVVARYVLDATGYHSWLARQAGILAPVNPEDIHGGIEVTVPLPDVHPTGEVRMWLGHDVAPWGYAWAFPSLENGLPHVRVGLGTPRALPLSAGKYFDRFLAAHPEYNGPVHHRMGGQIPTAPVAPILERDGLILLGDAARLTCPLTGGGIWGALASGEAAVEAVLLGEPASYPKRIKWLTDELHTLWMLKQFAYGLNDRELDELVQFIGGLTLPSDGSVNPIAERRRITRKLLLEHPGLMSTILRRGRFWRAVHPGNS